MLLLHKFTVIDFESISKGSQNSFTFMISYKSCSYVKFILDVLTCVAQRQKIVKMVKCLFMQNYSVQDTNVENTKTQLLLNKET